MKAVGKIWDIFNGSGITDAVRTQSNDDGISKLLEVMDQDFTGLSFTNLVDFDAKFGHRRDVQGYGQAIEAFDQRLPELLDKLREDDLLLITADHGNDPTATGTDHTREYVPLLAYAKSFKEPGQISQGHFSDIAATIAANFDLDQVENGKSFLNSLN